MPLVLILMAVGGFIIAPLLSYTSSGLKTAMTYERITDEFYAADAGIEDGLWQINNDHLDDIFTSPAYEKYNYSTTYQYPLSYDVEVNDIDATVQIENIWIPMGIDAPTNEEAEEIIQATTEDGIPRLIITGNIPQENTYQVKISYGKETSDGDLLINTIGVWLPPGVSYNDEGVCELETFLIGNSIAYSRNIDPHKGGEAVVWTIIDSLPFTDLPEVNEGDQPMIYAFDFEFELDDDESERTPELVSWITTSGVAGLEFTWDADVRVFHINSQAEGTTIDAYAVKSEMRELGSCINGDYRAIGSTLMLDLNPDWGGPMLDYLLPESDATVNDIPANAQVKRATLYWSAWVQPGEQVDTLFLDNGNNIYEYWYPGSDWGEYGWGWDNYYGAHHSYYHGDADRELEMKDPLPLSIYSPGSVTLSFDYWEGGRLEGSDCLKYALYDGSNWGWYPVFCDDTYGGTANVVIPEQYLTADFKLKFRIEGFDGSGWGGTETCYIDNIEITAESSTESIADTEVTFKIDGHQFYFADDEYGNPNVVPTEGEGDLLAKYVRVLENQPDEYSYACQRDVTELVQLAEDSGYASQGNATYTVGDVDADTDDEWSYAAWSLIIIYSSPETQRHQLYIFDDEFIYVDNNGILEYPLSGFLVPDPILGEANAAKITCFVGEGDDYYEDDYIALNPPTFPGAPNSYKLWDGTLSTEHPGSNTASYPNNVWNSKSIGLEETGIDIDTFYVTWESGLLEPGDTSALVALETGVDSWNLVYIIIAFRSETVSGGTITYLIDN